MFDWKIKIRNILRVKNKEGCCWAGDGNSKNNGSIKIMFIDDLDCRDE